MLEGQEEVRVGVEKTPDLDEGWWSAVLADEVDQQDQDQEVTLHETAPVSPASTAGPASTGEVDWSRIQEVYDHDEVIILVVHSYNRGGLLVQGSGVQGFVPVSHLVDMPGGISEEERFQKLATYVNRSLHLKVIECEPSQARVVLSERAALAGEGRRKQLFQSLKSNHIVQGVVTNVTEFGAFVDLGGVEGLIHVSELSWGRVQHPREVLQVGQKVQALVLQVSEENSRVALSLKRLFPNPWETLGKRYKPGDVIAATITDILRFGAFARLDEGVEGLIHISSISLPPDQKNLEDLLHTGQLVQVRILHIDVDRRRLGLGLVNFE
ncbi:MAG: S1 RNA-binding domain-containing protein [Anaerolineaceae bacterium]|jgi:small subunit ribosomal protein S1